MYLEFLYIPFDYFFTLSKKEKIFEIGIPFILCLLSCYFETNHNGIQLHFIKTFIPCAEIILGFILTALSIIVASDKFKETAKKASTKKEIRNVPISLYRLIITEFSFLILSAAIIICAYFISLIIAIQIPKPVETITNSAFIFLSFILLTGTIRAITNLYFTQCKQ